jgi:hypothetical protein
MKLFIGWVAAAGVLAATSAEAQVPVPYRLGAPPAVMVSDVGGPYAAVPPDYGPARYGPPPYALAVLPPREVFEIAREMGFQPLGAPQQRGLVYTLSAINVDGEDGRLVIDARNGRIMRFMPAYRMGDRMGEETASTYGPAGVMPELPQYRRAPQPLPRVASRTPSVRLPKKMPARAVATPAKPVTPAVPVAVAPPVVAPAAPVAQQAVVTPKPDEVRVIPMTATPPAAAPETPAPAAPTVAAPPVEAKPAAPASEAPATGTAPAAPPAASAQ